MILEDGKVIDTAAIGDLGIVVRIAAPEIASRASAGQFVHVRASTGFVVTGHQLVFSGLCGACAEVA